MEIKNQQIVEFNLKQEVESLQQARIDLEDQVSDQQSSICQYQLQLRQRDMETESQRRECQSLHE